MFVFPFSDSQDRFCFSKREPRPSLSHCGPCGQGPQCEALRPRARGPCTLCTFFACNQCKVVCDIVASQWYVASLNCSDATYHCDATSHTILQWLHARNVHIRISLKSLVDNVCFVHDTIREKTRRLRIPCFRRRILFKIRTFTLLVLTSEPSM